MILYDSKKYNSKDTVIKTRIIVVIIVSFLCLFIAFALNLYDPERKAYTHLFYLPVILIGTWFRKKAYIFSALIGIIHMVTEYRYYSDFNIFPFVRVCTLFLITFVVVFLSEKNYKLQNRLSEQLLSIQRVNDSVGDIMGRCDSNGNIRYVTKSIERVLGYSQEEVLNTQFSNYIFEEDKEILHEEIKYSLEKIMELRKEIRIISKKGNIIWFELVVNPIVYNNEYTGVAFLCYDITKKIAGEKEYKEMIYIDNLTGIYNRRFLDEIIDKQIKESENDKYLCSVMMLDIDNFKNVNDTYGHPVGDIILKEVAKIMQNTIRNNDYLTRYGGEEFFIVLPRTDVFDAWDIAERIRTRIEEFKFETVGKITISIGISYFFIEDTKEEIYKKADNAMYLAKSRGRNRVMLYSNYGMNLLNMDEIKWKNKWNSGDEHIDDQHKKLFLIMNKLIKENNNLIPYRFLNTSLSKIKLELIEHFSYEEYFMEQIGYIDVEEHVKIHNELLQGLEKILDIVVKYKITDSLIMYQIVFDIVVGHLEKEDSLYFPLVKNKKS